MARIFLLTDGRRAIEGTPFEYQGFSYPAAWISSASAEELNAAGFVELAPEPEPITTSMVQHERERRLAAGFDYTFPDARGVHRIGTTAADLVGWDEVTKISNALIATGMGSQIIHVQTDTGPLDLTAIEWQSVLLALAQFRQPIWLASFSLQAMSPIPADYASNIHW